MFTGPRTGQHSTIYIELMVATDGCSTMGPTESGHRVLWAYCGRLIDWQQLFDNDNDVPASVVCNSWSERNCRTRWTMPHRTDTEIMLTVWASFICQRK